MQLRQKSFKRQKQDECSILVHAIFGLQHNRIKAAGLLHEAGVECTKKREKGRFCCMGATNQSYIDKFVAETMECLHQNEGKR